jgi:hypothetical protein
MFEHGEGPDGFPVVVSSIGSNGLEEDGVAPGFLNHGDLSVPFLNLEVTEFNGRLVAAHDFCRTRVVFQAANGEGDGDAYAQSVSGGKVAPSSAVLDVGGFVLSLVLAVLSAVSRGVAAN